ncbi:putative RNA-directed DNA polymerase from transposon BS [Stylophora pistillata]|uniref:Putative RNA-directed DNA polymerase from transposon BS n=1 Tax=Stylophora pistillata TaxID=50429 RepID=A0A2B4RW96_STYPI|nr:putative RNA-directed DNA polymerase from transposon BS [Stylophora pistillata]
MYNCEGVIVDEPSNLFNEYFATPACSVCKLLEKVMYDQLYDAFKSKFSLDMSGFLRGHSCCTALLKIVDDWRLALDSKKITGTIAIDLSKAFDSICHNLLLAKLRAYGLNCDAIAFFQSNLTDRQQRVKFHSIFSEWRPVKCGVPQGSLLGPLLFNIFLVNDLNFAGQISSLRLYADDTPTYASNRDIITLETSLNLDLDILVTWFSQNYLIVNSIKTPGMILGSHAYVSEFFIGDSQGELSNSLKTLGVTIDNKLTNSEHISNVLKKVYAKIGALRQLKRLMPHSMSLSLYNAYLLPHLEYCSPLLIGSQLNFKL